MRVVALVSGGKDSCYSAMQCVAAGHTLVALANLQPEGKDELDSYMFQTVGHEGVPMMAKAMGLPLYRGVTQGQAVGRGLHYHPEEGDEVEDLFSLLRRVKEEEGVEGVASGAVLSDYQRLRVEHVCQRLDLVSLAYLWRRDQGELLREMTSHLSAIIIKVAAIGLTEAHLGKTLEEMLPHLQQLHRQYGVHMCGEGGEFESFTLDCPLFTHKIVVDHTEVCAVSTDAFAPVAYLKLSQLHLEKKPDSVPRVLPSPPQAKLCVAPALPVAMSVSSTESESGQGGRGWRWRVFEGIEGTSVTRQTQHIFSEMDGWLQSFGASWFDVAHISLYLHSMADYTDVNAHYLLHFPSRPPARTCIQLSLPEGVLVRVEVMVCQCDGGLVPMHVQSLSHWAPANIGPYSQAVKAGSVVLTAGQIGLQPATMLLAPPTHQPSLSLTHVCSVLEANHTSLHSTLCGLCYYTSEEAGWSARAAWGEFILQWTPFLPPLLFLRVPALPRGACVEWSFTVLTTGCRLAYDSWSGVEEGVGVVTGQEALCTQPAVGCWLLRLIPPPVPPGNLLVAVKVCLRHLEARLASSSTPMAELTLLRLCVPKHSSGPPLSQSDVASLAGCPALTVTVFEGYYGECCPVSLLALHLTDSLASSC